MQGEWIEFHSLKPANNTLSYHQTYTVPRGPVRTAAIKYLLKHLLNYYIYRPCLKIRPARKIIKTNASCENKVYALKQLNKIIKLVNFMRENIANTCLGHNMIFTVSSEPGG